MQHIRDLHSKKPVSVDPPKVGEIVLKVRVMIGKEERDAARQAYQKKQLIEIIEQKVRVPKLKIRPIRAPGPPGYKCHECKEDFSSPGDLQLHYTTEHVISETRIKEEPFSSPVYKPRTSPTCSSRPSTQGSAQTEREVARNKRKRRDSWITSKSVEIKNKKSKIETSDSSAHPPSSSVTEPEVRFILQNRDC